MAKEITKGKVSKSENNESILNDELTILKNLKNVFLIIAGSAFQKYGSEFQKHQQSLLGLSDMLIEIYFAESALLRTIKNNDGVMKLVNRVICQSYICLKLLI